MSRRFSGHRPQDEPISVNPSNMDFEKRALLVVDTISALGLTSLTRHQLFFHDGLIDGGDIGEPAKAIDYLDMDIDGGTF